MDVIKIVVDENTRYKMELIAIKCNNDYSITICGGEKYHVGAVAVASPHESIADDSKISATVSSVCLPKHKDDEIARIVAKKISSTFNCNVSVSAGVHINNATSDELQILLNNANKLCEKFIATVIS